MDNFNFFNPNLPKNGFCGRNFEKLSPDAAPTPPIYHACQFSGKTDKFDFFDSNLSKNGFWGQNFEKLSRDAESTPPRYHVC